MAIKPDSHCYIYNYPVRNTTSSNEKDIRSNSCRSEAIINLRNLLEPANVTQHVSEENSIIDYWYIEKYAVEERYECCFCPYSTKFKHMLDIHTRMHVGQFVTYNQQDPLDRELPTSTSDTIEENLNIPSELVTNNVPKKFSCSICDFKCTMKSTLAYHVKQTHVTDIVPKEFRCYYCTFVSNHKGTLSTHMRMHIGDKPFHCNKCKFKSTTKSDLKNHSRIHTGEKPYQCKICYYKSNRKSNLNLHLRSHTEKPFNCSVCFYRTDSKSDLLEHSRMHFQQKLLTCSLCDNYSTKSRSHLENHLRSHSGEKPFMCTVCDYKCTKESSLKAHLEVHRKSHMFTCASCNYSTVKKLNYNIHIKKHLGIKEFRCNICKYKTFKQSILNSHLKTHNCDALKVARVTLLTSNSQNLSEDTVIDEDLLELVKQEEIAIKEED